MSAVQLLLTRLRSSLTVAGPVWALLAVPVAREVRALLLTLTAVQAAVVAADQAVAAVVVAREDRLVMVALAVMARPAEEVAAVMARPQ